MDATSSRVPIRAFARVLAELNELSEGLRGEDLIQLWQFLHTLEVAVAELATRLGEKVNREQYHAEGNSNV